MQRYENTISDHKKNITLGIYANFSAPLLPLSKPDFSPLQALSDKEKHELERRVKNRLQSFTLRYISADIVNGAKGYSKDVHGKCRCWHCGRTPIKKVEYVDFVKGQKGKVFFAGLQHCTGYWICPVCVYKISEQRVNDIYDSLMEWRSLGKTIYMLTLTFPHYKSERLKPNLEFLMKAYDSVRKHKRLRKFTTEYLRSLEIKYGVNGFHPHLHCVFVIDESDIEYFELFKELWLDQLRKHNKKVLSEYAFNIKKWDDDLDTLKDYMCKWELGDELVKSQLKKGKENTFTPFELLQMISDKKSFADSMFTKRSPSDVFLEYAIDVKGKSQLRASRNFWLVKQMKTDKEICQDDKIDEVIYRVGYETFIALGRANQIHTAISVFEQSGLQALDKFVNNFVKKI